MPRCALAVKDPVQPVALYRTVRRTTLVRTDVIGVRPGFLDHSKSGGGQASAVVPRGRQSGNESPDFE